MNEKIEYRASSMIAKNWLAHHGIKGQHWGVHNGPPYPLDQKTSSRIKSGKNEKLHDKKKVGSPHYNSGRGTIYRRLDSDIEKTSWSQFYQLPKAVKAQYRDSELHLKDVNRFEYADGSWSYKNALEDSYIKDTFSSGFKSGVVLNSNTKKDINTYGFAASNDTVWALQSINSQDYYELPGVKSNNPDVSNNCSKCSDMVELVKRGLDPSVISAGRCRHGMMASATEYHWDGAVTYKEKSYDNIEKRIKKFGNKGSGVIGIRRADGSGHAMHFSTVKRDNGYGIEVQDGQVGRIYDSLRDALTAEGHDFNQFCKITRLDNATPNIDHMIEDSVIRLDSIFAAGKGYNSGMIDKRNPGKTFINDGNREYSLWGKK